MKYFSVWRLEWSVMESRKRSSIICLHQRTRAFKVILWHNMEILQHLRSGDPGYQNVRNFKTVRDSSRISGVRCNQTSALLIAADCELQALRWLISVYEPGNYAQIWFRNFPRIQIFELLQKSDSSFWNCTSEAEKRFKSLYDLFNWGCIWNSSI